MFFVSQLSGLVENFNIGIYSDTVKVINVKTLHDSTSLSFTCSYHFSDLDHVLWSQQCWTVFTEAFIFIQLSWNFVRLLSKSRRHWIYHYFSPLHIFNGDNWCFLILQNLWCLFLGGCCLREVFQTSSDYNLCSGSIHTRVDDLDFISRSHVCQNHELQIAFRFLSTVVYWCMVVTYIKKIKYCMFCVTGVYITDKLTVFVILHPNVSHLSICFSCWNIFFFSNWWDLIN